MVEKGIRKGVVNKTYEDFDGGMKQMWVGIKATLANRRDRQARKIAALRAQNGNMVNSWK